MVQAEQTSPHKLPGSKRFRAANENIEREKLYPIDEAIKLIKSNATAKFDETIELAFNLGVDPRQADQNIRGVISMPNGTGKTIRVAVFARDEKAEEAKAAGADLIGTDDLIKEIESGKIEFDRAIATPDMMPVLGKVARILGPRGLMPNPKLGTVTTDVKQAVKDAKGGQVEYRAEKKGIVHAGIGKASFSEKQLRENINALFDAIQKAKPGSVKGTYLKRIALSSTMGPGIRIDINSLKEAA